MIFARVIGTVVCTQKDPRMESFKLMLVEPVDTTLTPSAKPIVAVDGVGAGVGEVVLVVQGSSARQTVRTDGKPIDATIMAIVDTVELRGKTVFKKGAE